ncbi:probably inactive leucine-rich repeat receptor-like protein kinase At5g48380 [Magnolia sinica]|uniref:probably inactive leucine-rich repeat receptor-like protein kinase At5g48380 n=1 Tax=Magnolia sinica TaxID=86752 RepID=UPI00265891A2|nr:probably inactive leucine-rich repeat receptor-like protein kinase At5g48380 [Magnolia sinica]
MVNFMSMAMGSRATVFLLPTLFWLWLSSDTCNGVASDIQCLKDLKASLNDTNGYLSSWDFNNKTEGSICKFNGIECWHNDENKVLNIRLSNMGLKGRFPVALKNCTSMTGLDLSTNDLFGPLPDNIGSIIPYVTTLDLSYNNFTGDIPDSFGNCSYLNTLSLQHNRFTGQIPWQLGRLDRLSQFSVADNSLSGPIPPFFKKQSILASSFANNAGLCGAPLDVVCRGPVKKSRTSVIIGAANGGIVLSVIIIGVILLFSFRKVSEKKMEEEVEGNKWAKSIKGTKGIKISTFEESVPKMRLIDLMKATNNFGKDNVMGSGRMGTMYKAKLPDGTLLTVRRLEDSHHSDKHFISEMNTLGSIKHPNLVSLMGVCIERKERLLIYKYMPKGSLYENLHHPKDKSKFIEWPLRLRIAIGVARGLAWLHHCCSPCIIHCNISSKRILLEEDYEPKISDFGYARFMNPVETHFSTSVVGNFFNSVFIAPEYMPTLVPTTKGDVYSFGMVMLEVITGKEPTQVVNALQNFKGNLMEWIAYLSNYYATDESSTGRGCDGEILEFLGIAFSCVALDPEERPTMFQVYRLLRAIGESNDFTNGDEKLMPLDCINIDCPSEFNICPEIQEIDREGANENTLQ